MQSKKVFTFIGFICLIVVVTASFFYLKNKSFFKPASSQLTIKNVQGESQVVEPGVNLDTSEPNQGRFWVTGTIDKLETYDVVLAADQNSLKKDISYSVYQITLNVPQTENSTQFKVKAITLDAVPTGVTSDGVTFEAVPTPELKKNLKVGQEVRLSILNQEPEVFQSKWTQTNGGWNTHGEMMLDLLNKNRENANKLLNSPSSVTANMSVVFDGILYNQTK